MSLTNMTTSLSKIQRGHYEKLSEYANNLYVPPPIELYTIFSLQVYLLVFLGILFLHCLVILITDKIYVKTIPQSTTWWERIIHALIKSNMPSPFMNWHESNGSCDEHIQRHKATEFEVMLTICINLFFNMILLIPLVILCEF